jgi:hypothetical protein
LFRSGWRRHARQLAFVARWAGQPGGWMASGSPPQAKSSASWRATARMADAPVLSHPPLPTMNEPSSSFFDFLIGTEAVSAHAVAGLGRSGQCNKGLKGRFISDVFGVALRPVGQRVSATQTLIADRTVREKRRKSVTRACGKGSKGSKGSKGHQGSVDPIVDLFDLFDLLDLSANPRLHSHDQGSEASDTPVHDFRHLWGFSFYLPP